MWLSCNLHEETGGMLFRVLVLSSSRDWSNDLLNEAGQPLIVGDGAVTILVHLLEQSS